MASTFPASPVPKEPVLITPRFKTLISDFESGGEQRRQKWLYAKYDVQIAFPLLEMSDIQTLWDFYMARKGAYEAFWFFDPRPGLGMTVAHDGLYVGTGDGATEVFDLPGKSTSSQTIYVDGVEQTVTTDYVILTGGGDGSADRVDFVGIPNAGEIITCDFTGELRMRVRFAADGLNLELFTLMLQTVGIQLIGLAAA